MSTTLNPYREITVTTIAVLGAGRVGSAIARTAMDAGFEVNLAASGPAEDIALLAEIVTPGARAMTAADAVQGADIVVVAVPLHKHRTIDPTGLRGKIVVDAMNYWAAVDGAIDQFDADPRTSSEIVAEHFAGARVVKAFNHIGYHDLEEHRLPRGATGRRALAVASDDRAAAGEIAQVIERIGFDALDAGPLVAGAALEPGTEIFSGAFDAEALQHRLDEAAALASTPTLP
ncbi:NADPH-dependent F420 reductase [Microbacterium paulum]|uniref:NADPH-dependent F420 reductase n=1 Tax=Microbacterium paulum TaxID=2707006 RepID=UPI003083FD32